MVVVPFLLGKSFWYGWLFWAVLLFAFGLGHPVTADIDTPLDPMRRFAAWATIALFIVTFSPVPFSITAPDRARSTAGRKTLQRDAYRSRITAAALKHLRRRISL